MCSLPTGKTPEYFIKWVQRILKEWNTAEMQAEAKKFGLSDRKPVLDKLTFVQIDEFYPISPQQHNSFHYYAPDLHLCHFA